MGNIMSKLLEDEKISYIRIAVSHKKNSDIDDISSEMDYKLKHKDILSTEVESIEE